MTKDFLTNLTYVHDSIMKLSDEKGHFLLRFKGDKTGQPIISEVTRQTGAVFNIMAAGIQHVNNEEHGIMIADIGPDESAAERAIKQIRAMGVIVEESKEGYAL